jgi:hypothetical protein
MHPTDPIRMTTANLMPNTSLSRHRRRVARALIGALLLSTGCTSLSGLPLFEEKIPVADAQHPVMDMSCIWQEGEGRTPEGFPCRGFCGQLMFISTGSKKPAIVNGGVRVFVFDNQGTQEEQAKPLSVYEFTPEQWATFARKTNLGMTYQLFVPYTRKGNHYAECSVRICFMPADGSRPLYSQPTSITLNGRGGPTATAKAEADASTVRTSNANAEFQALARAIQTNRAAAPAEKSSADEAARLLLRQRMGADTQIQQLQAVLDQSARGEVDRAIHRQPTGRPEAVNHADYQSGGHSR